MKKYCNQCGVVYEKPQNKSLKNWEMSRYCSRECTNKAKIGKPSWNKGKKRTWESTGDFKKGNIPWNKGTQGLVKSWNKGLAWSEEHKEKLRGPRKHTANEKNHNWKGDKTSYHGIHIWVKRHKGNPKKCTECGRIGERKNNLWTIQWANKDHKYKRDLNDYIALCAKCHKGYDKANIH